MVLSKRERYIAIVSLSVAGILALDRLVYTPLMAQKEEIDMRIDSASEELIGARSLIKTSRDKGRDWAKMSGKGIPSSNWPMRFCWIGRPSMPTGEARGAVHVSVFSLPTQRTVSASWRGH